MIMIHTPMQGFMLATPIQGTSSAPTFPFPRAGEIPTAFRQPAVPGTFSIPNSLFARGEIPAPFVRSVPNDRFTMRSMSPGQHAYQPEESGDPSTMSQNAVTARISTFSRLEASTDHQQEDDGQSTRPVSAAFHANESAKMESFSMGLLLRQI